MKYFLSLALMLLSFVAMPALAQVSTNPMIFADVPDPSVLRVGDTYYMSSTTMHMNPGLPIMKSKDLINWEMLNYAYDTLVDNAATNLETERSAYGQGTWASSLRYHNDTFIVTTFSSTSGRTHVYTTKDIEKGDWKASSFSPSLHDHSLLFDDDGKVYMYYNGSNISLVELNPDLSGIKPGGINKVVIPEAGKVASQNLMLGAEGSQAMKYNGKYYVTNITWPRGGMRTQIMHRADNIEGPYEGKVILKDQGIAQGNLFDTPDGKWYAILFQDHGSVGRIPYLIPVKWEDGWPVLGVDGKVPMNLNIPGTKKSVIETNIVASDEFDRKAGEAMPLAWQWNHNPVNDAWSLTARKGYMRITTSRVDKDVLHGRNMLTQRTFGPESSASIKVEVANMKDGDYAGFIALQQNYGFVAVKKTGDSKAIVMVKSQRNGAQEEVNIPLNQDVAYFKIDCDFKNRTDKAYFYYSLDGNNWTRIGSTLQMSYTLPHFMGYRFGLFNFATKEIGGYADFDYYHVTDKIASVN